MKLAIYAVYIVTFSAITGVGGGIGIGISEATSQGSAYNIVTAVFLGEREKEDAPSYGILDYDGYLDRILHPPILR